MTVCDLRKLFNIFATLYLHSQRGIYLSSFVHIYIYIYYIFTSFIIRIYIWKPYLYFSIYIYILRAPFHQNPHWMPYIYLVLNLIYFIRSNIKNRYSPNKVSGASNDLPLQCSTYSNPTGYPASRARLYVTCFTAAICFLPKVHLDRSGYAYLYLTLPWHPFSLTTFLRYLFPARPDRSAIVIAR